MIRVSLRNSTGEAIDFFDATDLDNAAAVIGARLVSEAWLLAEGDTITIGDED